MSAYGTRTTPYVPNRPNPQPTTTAPLPGTSASMQGNECRCLPDNELEAILALSNAGMDWRTACAATYPPVTLNNYDRPDGLMRYVDALGDMVSAWRRVRVLLEHDTDDMENAA